jgi:hypothetical protein
MTDEIHLKRRSTPEAAWELAQQAIIQVVAVKAELARERARVDVLRNLLVSYGASRDLHPELWE